VAAGVLPTVSGVRPRRPNRSDGGTERRLPRIVGFAGMVAYVFLIRAELSSVRRGRWHHPFTSYGVANLSNVINSAVRCRCRCRLFGLDALRSE